MNQIEEKHRGGRASGSGGKWRTEFWAKDSEIEGKRSVGRKIKRERENTS